ncbi:MAG: hypothetical protein LJE68_16470 [Rhodobacter sp.]|nr:hypothetical protein [Rhodobacter sp.]
MSGHLARAMRRAIAQTIAVLALTANAAFPANLCPDDQGTPQFDPANHGLCAELWPEVQNPSAPDGTPKPLNHYEQTVGAFFNAYCHRDPDLTDAYGNGWAQDKYVRDTGPYVAHRDKDNRWIGEYHGFHAPVVIWYSPEMMAWLQANRPADPSAAPDQTAPIPDGAIIVKEMFTPPGSRCRGVSVENLKPANGIAYMIRDSRATFDGWFWGYFGYFPPGTEDPNIDWPSPQPDRPLNAPAYAGFGQYCVNCHASAKDNLTFSSLVNIKGQPGDPISYLSMDWFLTAFEGDVPEHVPQPGSMMVPIPQSTPLTSPKAGFDSLFNLPPGSPAPDVAQVTLPSQAYDNVWAEAGQTPPLSSEYLTSDQCAGCHDAGSTGLTFEMTQPNPHGPNLINLSPYATWRSSPMGLAGRDPIFFAQLASEEQFHDGSIPLIWNTCFGCHGIMGQRQFQLDQAQAGATCEDTVFDPGFVTAVPYDGAQTADRQAVHYDPEHARYGALARDGISCVACHRSVLTPEQQAKFGDSAQNQCVLARQQKLNAGIGGLEGFGRTFTGSFLVSDPSTVFGPFDRPKTKPMAHALGNIPVRDDAIASSEQCGTCHTVHLPVLWQPPGRDPQVIADTYEQTTYPEWLFSQYRTGTAAFLPTQESLPSGAGATPISCAGCHMESRDAEGRAFDSKIASIQERTNMPEAEYALASDDIDLPVRTGFARHTLVGLNLFLVKMAQQFPDILGIPLQDPMLTSKGMAGLERTELQMVDTARNRTADIAVTRRVIDQTRQTLDVDVRIDNLTGHKFPSGVSFRRAFVEFEVFDGSGNVIWHSGKTDGFGVLIDAQSGDPLRGELWFDDQCNKIVGQDDFQPHYLEINQPSQVQIYQEVKLDPGDPAVMTTTPSCARDAAVDPTANLTTSFLSICHTRKDNRLLPAGLLPYGRRVEIARVMGLVNPTADGTETEAELLAHEAGASEVWRDDDYETGGGDTIGYRIPLADLGDAPAAVRATLHYQATPPFYLQDRFCTGQGANRDRLFHLASLLDTGGTPIEDWTFRLVSTGMVALTP